jgi:hypothetical protein
MAASRESHQAFERRARHSRRNGRCGAAEEGAGVRGARVEIDMLVFLSFLYLA